MVGFGTEPKVRARRVRYECVRVAECVSVAGQGSLALFEGAVTGRFVKAVAIYLTARQLKMAQRKIKYRGPCQDDVPYLTIDVDDRTSTSMKGR